MSYQTIRICVAAFATIALVACSSPFDIASNDGVTVVSSGSSVVLHNGGPAPIGYAFWDAATAARTTWAPCAAADCPVVAPGESAERPTADIVGSGESDQVIAYWWHIIREPSGDYRIDSVRSALVNY
jgi:hypothetical protein